MRTISHPEISAVVITAVLYALSDPVRLKMVRALDKGDELPCCGFDIPLTKATLSHHFKVLREAGITACRAKGTQRMLSLRRRELDRHFPGLLDAVLKGAAKLG